MPAQLLVVEDDDNIRAALRLGLEDEGYEVLEAASAEDALDGLDDLDVEAMIVDLMLGGMDGFSYIREVRRARDIPILIVSARGDTHDIVAGLEAGADDYVTKPFHVKEITARLRALQRRAHGSSGGGEVDVLLDGDADAPLVLAPVEGTLRRGGVPVHLTLTEFRLLGVLAEAPRQVFSRRALLERVWDHGYFGDERLVDVHISRLRSKVERDPAQPAVIVTVRGMGYRLDPR
ncbi:MAG: winged helix-turn-helix domain-containing protein [Actinomycetes bacterium]